jgi:hypothetical protein
VQAELDEHYKDLVIKYIVDGNAIEIQNGDYIDVLSNFTLQVLCTPRDYTVSFNACGKGHDTESVEITYLTPVPFQQTMINIIVVLLLKAGIKSQNI